MPTVIINVTLFVNLASDNHPNVNAKRLVPYDPLYDTIVPEGKRPAREHLKRITSRLRQTMIRVATVFIAETG
jgi:hypothetical protein